MRRKEQAEVEPRSCQETNKGETHNKKQEENRKETKTRKERRETSQKTHQANKPKGTADKQARSPYLTPWWKVLMLNQKLVRDCLELLLGKPSASVQMN